MKKQIKRLSPHQNGKVFGILSAVSSLPFFIPMWWMMSALPSTDAQGNPVEFPSGLFFAFPIMYLIFGYLFVAVGCLVYNVLVQFIGGFEFEVETKED
jgi:hypothetical protein